MDWNQYLIPVLLFAVIIAVTAVTSRVARFLIGRAMRHRQPQVAASAALVGSVVIWLIGAVLAIQELGISPDILLLVVGLLGVAALIGVRVPLENYGGKYFSDVYGPFKVGDSVEIEGRSGKIIEINAMSTILLADDDQLLAIPNSLFISRVVVNTTPQAWKELTIPLSVPGSVDLPEFEGALLRSLSKLRSRLDRRFPPVIATRSRTPQAAELTVTVMIRRPEDREAILQEVNKRISEVRGTVHTGAGRGADSARSTGEPAPAPPLPPIPPVPPG